jgi:hypothetical protein
MDKMCQNCPVCGEPSEPEPNFYYGAMYVSYAYTVALFVSMTMWPTIGLLILVLVALGPYIFRLSRITYLNFFVDYDKDAASKS